MRARRELVQKAHGQAPPQPQKRELYAPPGAPAELTRKLLLGAALSALFVALVDTEHAGAFNLQLPKREGLELSRLEDPWDYWVVSPGAGGELELGRGFHFIQANGSLDLRRITETDKLRLGGWYERQLSRFRLEDGSDVRGDVYGLGGRAMYARTLGSHWALGAAGTFKRHQYENIEGHTHYGPVVEFSIFPYAMNASEQLRAAYQAGLWGNWYYERTVFGKTRELRPYHALTLIAEFNKSWGSLQCAVQLNSFLDQPDQARLSGSTGINLQLFEGLVLDLGGTASWIGDQISLRERPLTNLELLLGTAQQPTDFSVTFEFGFSYTFGSVHNTIVNPRFGRLDLEED